MSGLSSPAATQTRALYVCYYSLREPLTQTQVLPYLRELAFAGVKLWLLTFEPRGKVWAGVSVAVWRERLRREGIEWEMSTYHKRPSLPAKILDILVGAFRVTRIVRREKISLVHARSDVAAVMALLTRPFTGARVLFDIRGLLADEYADNGNWKANGWLYRITKRVEKTLFRADGFVVLTERVRSELFGDRNDKPVEVIPCCFDPSRWTQPDEERREKLRGDLGARQRTVIVYAGSLGGMYLPEELADFFVVARQIDPKAFFLVLSQTPRELITDHLSRLGVSTEHYHVTCVSPDQMPAYLGASDIGISFVKPSYSKIASSPTKFAEYLASGLPVISTRGIGDLDGQITNERVGAILDRFTPEAYAAAYRAVDALRKEPGFRDHARQVASRLYDLTGVGVPRYFRLYRAMMAGSDGR